MEKLFNRTFKNLIAINVILKTYSGEPLEILGKLEAKINHNNVVYKNLLYVVKRSSAGLLRLDVLIRTKIDLFEVNNIVCKPLNALIDNYKNFFSEKLVK